LSRGAPVLWCLLAAALFGASTPASKLLLDGVGPLTLAGLLYLGAALATAPFSLKGGSKARRRDPANLRRLGGAVLFGGILGPIALLLGLQLAPAASVSLWINLESVATAALAWLFFKEHMDGRTAVANLAVVAAGVWLSAPEGFRFAPAALLVLGAAVCWGLDNNLTAMIDGYTPAQSTFVKGLVAGLVNLGLGLTLEGGLPSLAVLGGALLLGALAYGASIVLYIAGAQQLGATRSQMIFASAPFVGVALSWIALGEPVLGAQVGAGLLMIGALVLMLTADHGHEHDHEALTHTHPHRHDDGHHTHTHPGLPADAWHTHEHGHEALTHTHPHQPDLHHRHSH
jgi:drug/metabolite transporter (DMT)-like permease